MTRGLQTTGCPRDHMGGGTEEENQHSCPPAFRSKKTKCIKIQQHCSQRHWVGASPVLDRCLTIKLTQKLSQITQENLSACMLRVRGKVLLTAFCMSSTEAWICDSHISRSNSFIWSSVIVLVSRCHLRANASSSALSVAEQWRGGKE